MPENEEPEAPPAPAPPAAPPPAPAPVPPPTMLNLNKAWSVGKDLLTLLMIPAMGWLIKLEVANAERDLHIAQLQKDVIELRVEIQEAESIDDKVQANSIQLVRLEGKLDTANGRLDDIKMLLVR
jgi:hypothetical protein